MVFLRDHKTACLQGLREASVQVVLPIVELCSKVPRIRVGLSPRFDAIAESLGGKVLSESVFVYFAVPR